MHGNDGDEESPFRMVWIDFVCVHDNLCLLLCTVIYGDKKLYLYLSCKKD